MKDSIDSIIIIYNWNLCHRKWKNKSKSNRKKRIGFNSISVRNLDRKTCLKDLQRTHWYFTILKREDNYLFQLTFDAILLIWLKWIFKIYLEVLWAPCMRPFILVILCLSKENIHHQKLNLIKRMRKNLLQD